MSTPHAAATLYLSGMVVLGTGIQLGSPPGARPVGPLQRALARGELAPGVPRLEPGDPMANAAILNLALGRVAPPRLSVPDGEPCEANARTVAVLLDGRLSRVRFGGRAVCQLARLKRISVAQPGFGQRGLAEVAAFVLGRRAGDDVDVTRVVVPPFRFTGDTLTFVPADLGPLEPNERLIGTYHTHPQDDLSQGVLSDVDLEFMHAGRVDFHGQVGRLAAPAGGLDWLLDIVEPRDGEWNVFAHDGARLEELRRRCAEEIGCPLNDLRLAGSRYYLLTRYYEEREEPL